MPERLVKVLKGTAVFALGSFWLVEGLQYWGPRCMGHPISDGVPIGAGAILVILGAVIVLNGWRM
jgi:hypothetical protein